MFILDTDHLSILQRRAGVEFDSLYERLRQQKPGDLYVSIISMHEQFLGWHKLISKGRLESARVQPYRQLGLTLIDYQQSQLLLYAENAADAFILLRSQGVRIGTMDLRIASIALANEMTLLTRNSVDFDRVPGLRHDDWTVRP